VDNIYKTNAALLSSG